MRNTLIVVVLRSVSIVSAGMWTVAATRPK